MNTEKEKSRLVKIIKIPVTDIKFFDSYCDLYYKNIKIGALSIFDVKGILHYDTNKESLVKLDWPKIYLDNKDTLIEKIRELLKLEEVNVTIGTFRRLYARDTENNFLGSFECNFENDTWRVYKED